jgi:hypothetical protein
MEHRWCVEEMPAGLPVAQGSAQSLEEAQRECMHYAMQYAQDGHIRAWVRANRKTVFSLEMQVTRFDGTIPRDHP